MADRDEAVFLLGHARVDITPPLGVSMAGYAHRKDAGCTAIEQEIQADVCYLQQQEERLILIAVDLVRVDEFWGTPLRERIGAATNLPLAHIVIMASHTHFGPSIGRPVNDAHQAWEQEFVEKIYQTALQAVAATQPVTVRTATADISRIAYNRRPVRADGTCCTAFTLPPQEDGLQFRPIDPKQTVLRFDASDGRPALLIVSTPMHAVVGGADSFAISPDYPGVLRNALERVYGAPALFAAGTAGNVVPFKRGLALRQVIGNFLAGAAMQAAEMAEPCGGRLGLVQERFDLPVAERHSVAEMEAREHAARDHLAAATASGDAWKISRAQYDLRRAEALCNATKQRGPGNTLPFDITVVSLGALAVVCLPGEIFAETGLYIRSRSPFPHTLVVSLANQATGYLATRNALWEGGYEGASSQYSGESESRVTDKAVELMLRVWEKTR